MAKPTLKPNWQSLYYPLQLEVWGSIAASICFVFVVLILMKNRESGTWWVVKQVIATLLDEAISEGLPRWSSTRIVLTTWLISSFILGTVYRSNLTACLTVPKYPPRAETFADLVDAGTE
ncbi:hypothetical protein O3P69_020265 [Scylla paramamosain]|uniref:Ionotropic glutamate receptor C-terminal domain-containing protein n=1 Tax=Scylla paramamosain TaxID=85552 RepID=A0AAW0TNK9_SCYPA